MFGSEAYLGSFNLKSHVTIAGTIISIVSKDLWLDIANRVQQIKVEEPPKRKAGIKVANVAELVSKLKNEAKVI